MRAFRWSLNRVKLSAIVLLVALPVLLASADPSESPKVKWRWRPAEKSIIGESLSEWKAALSIVKSDRSMLTLSICEQGLAVFNVGDDEVIGYEPATKSGSLTPEARQRLLGLLAGAMERFAFKRALPLAQEKGGQIRATLVLHSRTKSVTIDEKHLNGNADFRADLENLINETVKELKTQQP